MNAIPAMFKIQAPRMYFYKVVTVQHGTEYKATEELARELSGNYHAKGYEVELYDLEGKLIAYSNASTWCEIA